MKVIKGSTTDEEEVCVDGTLDIQWEVSAAPDTADSEQLTANSNDRTDVTASAKGAEGHAYTSPDEVPSRVVVNEAMYAI